MSQCSVCGSEPAHFHPLPPQYREGLAASGCPYPLERFETLNADQYTCSACGASDRERLMALYLRREWQRAAPAAAAILEIAPAMAFSEFLHAHAADYRSADLMSPLAMDKVDITDMYQYADGRFDLVVCSHVLEHVHEDLASLWEINRVLKPGGRAVLLVPLPLDLQVTDELAPLEPLPEVRERVRRFGQDDHIRMYARADFIERIGSAGFAVQQLTEADFGAGSFPQHGIGRGACLYVGHKPA